MSPSRGRVQPNRSGLWFCCVSFSPFFFLKTTKQNILFGFFGTSVPSRGLRVINEPVETMATASLDLKPLFHWFFFSMFVCVPPSFSVRRIRGPSISYQFKCDNQTRLNLSGSFLRPAQRFHFPTKKIKWTPTCPKRRKVKEWCVFWTRPIVCISQ